MNRIFIAAVLAILAVTPAFGKDQRADRNKAVVRRVFTDILSQGKFEVAAEIYAKDYVNQEPTKDLGLDESEARRSRLAGRISGPGIDGGKRIRRRRLCDGFVERTRHEHGHRERPERDWEES
jgi:hypothetical protein